MKQTITAVVLTILLSMLVGCSSDEIPMKNQESTESPLRITHVSMQMDTHGYYMA